MHIASAAFGFRVGHPGLLPSRRSTLLWVRAFDTVEQPRWALIEFRETYSMWLIAQHGFWPLPGVHAEQLPPTALAA